MLGPRKRRDPSAGHRGSPSRSLVKRLSSSTAEGGVGNRRISAADTSRRGVRVLVRVMGNVQLRDPLDQCVFVERVDATDGSSSKQNRDRYLSDLAAAGLLARKNHQSAAHPAPFRSHLTTIHLMDPTLVKASFDRAFHVHDYIDSAVDNAGLFENNLQPMIDESLDRLVGLDDGGDDPSSASSPSAVVQDALCFIAYGHTFSGKTYSVFGNGEQEGMLSRCAKHLLARSRGASLFLAMVEVYCDNVFDLLNERSRCVVKSNANANSVIGLSCPEVRSEEELLSLVSKASSLRATSATNRNPVSSRSHAILTLTLPVFSSGGTLVGHYTVCLVDLAGSERHTDNYDGTAASKEGIKINQSLTALSTVIERLSRTGATSSSGKVQQPSAAVLGFRDTVLTQLLQPYLAGSCQTVFLGCIHPHVTYYDETLSTLRYVSRLLNVDTGGPRTILIPKPIKKASAQQEVFTTTSSLIGKSRIGSNGSPAGRQSPSPTKAPRKAHQSDSILKPVGANPSEAEHSPYKLATLKDVIPPTRTADGDEANRLRKEVVELQRQLKDHIARSQASESHHLNRIRLLEDRSMVAANTTNTSVNTSVLSGARRSPERLLVPYTDSKFNSPSKRLVGTSPQRSRRTSVSTVASAVGERDHARSRSMADGRRVAASVVLQSVEAANAKAMAEWIHEANGSASPQMLAQRNRSPGRAHHSHGLDGLFMRVCFDRYFDRVYKYKRFSSSASDAHTSSISTEALIVAGYVTQLYCPPYRDQERSARVIKRHPAHNKDGMASSSSTAVLMHSPLQLSKYRAVDIGNSELALELLQTTAPSASGSPYPLILHRDKCGSFLRDLKQVPVPNGGHRARMCVFVVFEVTNPTLPPNLPTFGAHNNANNCSCAGCALAVSSDPITPYAVVFGLRVDGEVADAFYERDGRQHKEARMAEKLKRLASKVEKIRAHMKALKGLDGVIHNGSGDSKSSGSDTSDSNDSSSLSSSFSADSTDVSLNELDYGSEADVTNSGAFSPSGARVSGKERVGPTATNPLANLSAVPYHADPISTVNSPVREQSTHLQAATIRRKSQDQSIDVEDGTDWRGFNGGRQVKGDGMSNAHSIITTPPAEPARTIPLRGTLARDRVLSEASTQPPTPMEQPQPPHHTNTAGPSHPTNVSKADEAIWGSLTAAGDNSRANGNSWQRDDLTAINGAGGVHETNRSSRSPPRSRVQTGPGGNDSRPNGAGGILILKSGDEIHNLKSVLQRTSFSNGRPRITVGNGYSIVPTAASSRLPGGASPPKQLDRYISATNSRTTSPGHSASAYPTTAARSPSRRVYKSPMRQPTQRSRGRAAATTESVSCQNGGNCTVQ